jgi:hypothetical protein
MTCEDAPATTRWGFPVCQDCYDDLVDLDGVLKTMEADDPELKAAGERVEESWRRLLVEHRTHAAEPPR